MEDYSRLMAVIVSAIALGVTGCRSRLAPPLPAGQDVVPPGESMVRGTDDPVVVKRCTKPPPGFLWIDAVEVKPLKVQKGGKINHRFTYTFCPQAPSSASDGVLTTSVSYAKRKLVSDTVNDYQLKPGQWTVDTVIVIPPDAAGGAYLLEMSFVGDGAPLKRSSKFSVY